MVYRPFLKNKNKIYLCGIKDLNRCEAMDSKIECIKMKWPYFIPLGQNLFGLIEV